MPGNPPRWLRVGAQPGSGWRTSHALPRAQTSQAPPTRPGRRGEAGTSYRVPRGRALLLLLEAGGGVRAEGPSGLGRPGSGASSDPAARSRSPLRQGVLLVLEGGAAGSAAGAGGAAATRPRSGPLRSPHGLGAAGARASGRWQGRIGGRGLVRGGARLPRAHRRGARRAPLSGVRVLGPCAGAGCRCSRWPCGCPPRGGGAGLLRGERPGRGHRGGSDLCGRAHRRGGWPRGRPGKRRPRRPRRAGRGQETPGPEGRRGLRAPLRRRQASGGPVRLSRRRPRRSLGSQGPSWVCGTRCPLGLLVHGVARVPGRPCLF